ncbi:MAG: hydroxymethylbilane synthase [Candidatus Deianiraeaceae bacterium]|jgi:hydroxymethylbilane synthase
MSRLIVAGRESKLSQVQIGQFVAHLANNGIVTESKYVKTFGDIHTNVPINQLPITNPFTKEIHQEILKGDVDLGVSSLKDVEISETDGVQTIYFSERKNPRDILLLSKKAVDKILKGGQEILIGTSSKRRQFLFKKIAEKILPNRTLFNFKNIRGNITTRIEFVKSGEVDGIIIAMAGVLRLAESVQFTETIKRLMSNTLSIVLPITHFPTPPGQGVIVAQCKNGDKYLDVQKLSNRYSKRIASLEKEEFLKYGKGCKEGYGVTHLVYKGCECTFIKGVTSAEKEINIYKNFQKPEFTKMFDGRKLRPLMQYTPIKVDIPSGVKKFIVASINAVNSHSIVECLQSADEVWALGLMTQKKLIEMGILCNGNLEALGVDAFDDIYFTSNLKPLNKEEYCVLTYEGAKVHKGCQSVASYEIKVNFQHQKFHILTQDLSLCDAVFWSSAFSYEQFKDFFVGNTHICLLGETYCHIKSDDIAPYGIFNFDVLDTIIGKV